MGILFYLCLSSFVLLPVSEKKEGKILMYITSSDTLYLESSSTDPQNTDTADGRVDPQ